MNRWSDKLSRRNTRAWTAVSIRAVASRCSVSTGTIYNYYESKADLLGDTIESIWREIFFHPEDESVFKDVTACISWIYKRLEYGNEQFPGFFSLHSFGFMKNEKRMEKRKCCKPGSIFLMDYVIY